jgi:hypothetical protein
MHNILIIVYKKVILIYLIDKKKSYKNNIKTLYTQHKLIYVIE